jgi:hypothetical protein
VKNWTRHPFERARVTVSNSLADRIVNCNGEERWVENRTKHAILGLYDFVAEPIRTRRWKAPRFGNDRTAYLIGLFGTGRWYVYTLMRQNLGKRAKYVRGRIRFHPGPTSMIYGGHATIKYVSRAQRFPAVTSRILEAVRAGFADLIFIYRHPLDSLLTNWVWWRTYLREKSMQGTISEVYTRTDDLCATLDRSFREFKAFAEGDPDFFRALRGPRFLSFPEFVEETELYLHSATLALRFEDFMIDPLKEFRKIAELMSVDIDLDRVCLPAPRTKPYRYLAVKEKVPPFRDFIDGLDAQTKRLIGRIGYCVDVLPSPT